MITMTASNSSSDTSESETRKIRYAVVGLGHIAQAAILPAFENAQENSELKALISDDPVKLEKLGKKYGVDLLYSYDQYEACLKSGQVDAVYIALPNNMHKDFTVRAAECGIHVLCEKPMAVTERDCESMVRAASNFGIKLMVAYRLHFEEATLKAMDIVHSGKIGEPRIFNSIFTMQVKEGDIRLQKGLGGGTLYDIGLYCINAARCIFKSEPVKVFAFGATNGQQRFKEVDEMSSAVLYFPGDRLATFTTSFGASDVQAYRVVGTKGDLLVEPAFDYAAELRHRITLGDKCFEQSFEKRDQFAPEIVYFSNCVLKDETPEPSGIEGLADVRVIRALYRSAEIGRPVRLGEFDRDRWPAVRQEIKKPAVREPELVHTESPTL